MTMLGLSKDLHERSMVTLTIHANARTVTNVHTQVPVVRVSLTVRVTLTIPGQPRIVSHAYSSAPCQSIPDYQSYPDNLRVSMCRQTHFSN